MPVTYSLGGDISFPVTYDPFATFTSQGRVIADATQEDSTTLYVTRAASVRRLDYIIHTVGIPTTGDEVYNSIRDNGIDDPPVGNWLPKSGSPLASGVSAAASDHFPVFGDFSITTTTGPPPVGLLPGDVVVSEADKVFVSFFYESARYEEDRLIVTVLRESQLAVFLDKLDETLVLIGKKFSKNPDWFA